MNSMEVPCNTASGSGSLPQTIRIFSTGTQLEASPGTRVKSETAEESASDNNRTNRNSRARSTSFGGRKRKRQTSVKNGDHHPRHPMKTVKEDDTSAHLHPLQDYLLHGLDVVFCGINPGQMSAETGHHYANPTNHFWRCLHRSGITTTLVSPFEDFSLPERFNIGLVSRPRFYVHGGLALIGTLETNLVDQSSTQACELSRTQMMASVPALLYKVARYRPRFLCFVGVIIWDIVRNSLMKLLPSGTTKSMGKGQHGGKNQMGLQSYMLVWQNVKGAPQETLIFVVPSTSGRVVHYQLPDKIALFTELHSLMQKRACEVDTSKMESIFWRSDES